MTQSPRFGLLVLLGAVLLAVPLLMHAYNGTSARYLGDDYCAAAVFQEEGLIGGQIWFYRNWSAVPTTIALLALMHPADYPIAAVLPAIVIALWLGLAIWAVKVIVGRWAGCRWSTAALVGTLIVFGTIETTPHIIQSVYLRVPMLAYSGPLVAATLYAGLAAVYSRGQSASWPGLLLSALVTLVAGAFGPVYVAGQTAALGIATLIAWLLRRRALTHVLTAGIAGSILALAVVALAPGNQVRQQVFAAAPGWFAIAKWSTLYAAFMFVRPVLPLVDSWIVALVPSALGSTPKWLPTAMAMAVSPLAIVLVISIPAAVAYRWASDRSIGDLRPYAVNALRWTFPVAFVVVVACVAPGAFAMSAPPPPRALIIPNFVIITACAVWGTALGLLLAERRIPRAVARLVLAVSVVLTVWTVASATVAASNRRHELQAWAERWDETDRQLRTAHATGVRKATVPIVGSIGGVGSIAADPNDWVNLCAARYYDLESISATSAR